jgi:hypothetical protein
VQWYRHALELRSGDTRYVEPLAPSATDGRRYRVETDRQGRLRRVGTFIGARQVAEVVYHFDGTRPETTGYDVRAADGELTTRVRIVRDEHGRRTRQEFLLLDGRLTSYRVRTYTDGRVESVQYSATGTPEGRTLLVYSDEDVLLRSRWFPAASSTYYDTRFDPRTGRAKDRHKYRDGALDSSSRNIHDDGGLLTRSIHYDAWGRRYGTTDFSDGLKVVSRLDFADGSTLEIQFSHDDKRRTRQARYAYNRQPIFTLAYERLPNGRIVRTIAVGPKGEVWAEYPDLYVEYVERSGEAVDRPGVAKIYWKRPWWPELANLRTDRRPPPARPMSRRADGGAALSASAARRTPPSP